MKDSFGVLFYFMSAGAAASGRSMVEHDRDGGVRVATVIDAECGADLFCGMLYLPKAVSAAAIEVCAGVADEDLGITVHFY